MRRPAGRTVAATRRRTSERPRGVLRPSIEGWCRVDVRRPVQVFGGAALATAVAGVVALVTHQPWLFPSLGPMVMLHVEKPQAPESSPRNTLIGHAVALLAGYAFLVG